MKARSPELFEIIYRGPSMWPALRNLDRLFCRPYRERRIKVGDVVIINTVGGIRVIHRVHAINSSGVISKGDNNIAIDPWIADPQRILGKVVFAYRGRRRIHVWGGIAGQIHSIIMASFCRFFRASSSILKIPYGLLCKSKFIHLPIKTKILIFKHPAGDELHVLLGPMTVGRRPPGQEWQIRPPFKIFLDEIRLP